MNSQFPVNERRQTVSRRQLLRNAAVGFGSLALTGILHEASLAEERSANIDSDPDAAGPHLIPKAKRVIFLFMKGGPSHMDTFDPKPLLDRDHDKELPFKKPRIQFAATTKLLRSPWKFHSYGESGKQVSELFPNVAQHVDKICFLHSVHGTNPSHGGACLKLFTGSDNFIRPSMGSWISYGLGSENQNLPGFITICPTLAHGGVRNFGSAFLPASHSATPMGVASKPSTEAKVKYVNNEYTSRRLQRLQLDLLAEMNSAHLQENNSDAELEARIRSFELAFRMQDEIPQVEDLSKETAATLSLYGLDNPVTADFGRQCLLARRFAERGVRFVQVTHSNTEVQWDQHSNLKQGHEQNAAEVDLPISGLLADLDQRGLLEDTLVIWGGEFGRTPVAESKDGRDHNPHGFTMWMAGGGVKPGFQYGATDDYGYFAVEDKMHIHDLHATILHLLGIDHERLTYRYAGRDFRLTDVAGNVAMKIIA
jgi:hypothetical protein